MYYKPQGSHVRGNYPSTITVAVYASPRIAKIRWLWWSCMSQERKIFREILDMMHCEIFEENTEGTEWEEQEIIESVQRESRIVGEGEIKSFLQERIPFLSKVRP